jgi:hypothetical protein
MGEASEVFADFPKLFMRSGSMIEFKQYMQLGIISSLVAIAIPVAAAPQISEGVYISNYPANYAVEIKNGSYIVSYDGDDPAEPAQPIPEKVFKSVTSGVFYSNANKKYYCLFDDAIEQRMIEGKLFVCAASGWSKE